MQFYAPISHSPNVSVCPSSSLTVFLCVTFWHQYITDVGVRQCWTVAQTLSAAAARQRQSGASECIHPDAVGPTDVHDGGAQVIELLSQSRQKQALI